MTDKLRECPFCGGEAELRKYHNELENYVVCVRCASRTPFVNTAGDAIKRWNTRKPMDRIVEQLEGERKSILGKYDHNTPVLDRAVCKVAFNNGIDKAIAIVKGVQNE